MAPDTHQGVAGAYGLAAYYHVLSAPGILRDDPRYRTLLTEAGITW